MRVVNSLTVVCLSTVLLVAATAFNAHADARTAPLGQANREATAEAIAHFARARALLVTALNEFDRGRKIARPDDLLDPVKWRNTLIDRAEDLERGPKARRIRIVCITQKGNAVLAIEDEPVVDGFERCQTRYGIRGIGAQCAHHGQCTEGIG